VIRTFTEVQLAELTGMSEEQRRELEESRERLNELFMRQSRLIERYQQGDRSNEFFGAFLTLELELSSFGCIDYTDEMYRLFNAIHEEALKRQKP
jgi:hypothetical protein